MADNGRVEMIRIPRAEEVYAKEDVFGRDTTSVFPNAAKEATTLDADRVKELIGASNFISESQLEELKAAGRARVEDGAVSVDKSLAEVLAENKAKKDAEHKAKWEIMKQGKNKPLDEDEVEFLDTVVQQQAAADRAARLEEQRELDAFREALQQRVAPGEEAEALPGASKPEVRNPPAPRAAPRAAPKAPMIKPVVKVRAKGSDAPPQPVSKRAKTEDASEQAGLAALVGVYGSDDD